MEAVNFTHNPQHAQMDVKLRSLICLGLNEQVSYGNIGYGVSSWGIKKLDIFLPKSGQNGNFDIFLKEITPSRQKLGFFYYFFS